MNYPVIDMKATGSHLHSLLKSRGISVLELSQMMGIANKSTVYKWMRGDALPGIDNLLVLSVILSVNINDLLVTQEA